MTFEYTDVVFLDAVSLGCAPEMVGSQSFPKWRCTCVDAAHGDSGFRGPIITLESLQEFKRKTEKPA